MTASARPSLPTRALRSLRTGVLALLPAEWRKPIAALFVTGLALVPIIYAGNMTWSFDDPSGNLDQVTAAVVDLDEGADVEAPDGSMRHLEVGEEFTDTLLSEDRSTVYRFVEATPEQARNGLADGTFGATIEIPATFSADVGSIGEAAGDPSAARAAVLTVRTNDTINYVSGNFTKSVGTAITDALRGSVLEEYLEGIYLSFTDLHEGLDEAAGGAADLEDGAGELTDGAEELAGGAGDLHAGAGDLAEGSGTLVVGLGQLEDGSADLQRGAGQLAGGAERLDSGLGRLEASGADLRDGSSRLAEGTDQVSGGASRLADGSAEVAGGTARLDAGVTDAEQRLEDLGVTQETVDQASTDFLTALDDYEAALTSADSALEGPGAASEGLATDAEGLSQTATDIGSGAQDLSEQATTLSQDAQDVSTAASPLVEDAGRAEDSAQTAEDSAATTSASAEDLESSVTDYSGDVDDLAARCADSGADAAFCAELQGTADGSQALREDSSALAGESATAAEDAATASEATGGLSTSAEGIAETAATMQTSSEEMSTTAGELQTTSEDLQGPLADLATGTRTLADDVAAAREITGGSAETPGAGSADLRDRADALVSQSRGAAQALPGAYSTLADSAEGVHQLRSGSQQLAEGSAQLEAGSRSTAQGAGALDKGVEDYTGGVSAAHDGSRELTSGAGSLEDGAGSLHDGITRAESAAGRLEDGATQLEDGAGQLQDGADRLGEGAGQLQDGSGELGDGLIEARDQVPSSTTEQSAQLAGTASEPVSMDFVRENGLDRFGEGLVPLFLGIGLWVGGMAIFLMMPPFSDRAAAAGRRPLALLAGGLAPALLLGAVQALIAVAILQGAVGITPDSPGLLVGIAIATSAVFVALNHGFGALFGPVGKFIALVLIALQVSGAGGTYPVATLPGFFRAIHPYLPMSHAVDAFRGAIGGGWVDPRGDLLWLGGWFVLALVLGWLGAWKVRRAAQGDGRAAQGDEGVAAEVSAPAGA